VRFIVPVAAGGPTDIVARILVEQLSKIWGVDPLILKMGRPACHRIALT
jgi:tripartite-type tricarboxylate transporter receptor subunit TctC